MAVLSDKLKRSVFSYLTFILGSLVMQKKMNALFLKKSCWRKLLRRGLLSWHNFLQPRKIIIVYLLQLHFGKMDIVILWLKFKIRPYIGNYSFTYSGSFKHLYILSCFMQSMCLCAVFVKLNSCWHLLYCGVFAQFKKDTKTKCNGCQF